MSTATIRAGVGAVEGEDFTTAVLGPVVEGRPRTAVPVESPVDEPAEPMPNTIEARVRRGALLLDATTPGWAARIFPDLLAMWSCSRCLLGQLYRDFDLGRLSLQLHDDDSAVAHGFMLPDDTPDSEMTAESRLWLALADAWRIEIRSRRPEGRGVTQGGGG
jgi:hypothetical protein